MLKIETLSNMQGFVNGNAPGEVFYSQLMSKSRFGFIPSWLSINENDNSTVPNMKNIYAMSEGISAGQQSVFGMDNSQGIFLKTLVNPWVQAYKVGQAANSGGLIFDSKNRLLYCSRSFLGMYNGGSSYTGTASVTNGSNNVVGSGTSFGAGDVDYMFSVDGVNFYRIFSFTDSTHITLASPFLQATNASAAFTIYRGWNDKFKAFGTAIDDSPYPMERYEDAVLIGRGNLIDRLNYDDSINDDSNPAFNMPSGFKVVAIKGNKGGILMGFNFNSQGVLVLWDNYSTRSISPWIWVRGNIQAIERDGANWIVTTTTEILTTDGYNVTSMPEVPDALVGQQPISSAYQGTLVVRDYFFLLQNAGDIRRNKSGVYVLNKNTLMWDYIPLLSKYFFGVRFTSIFLDSFSIMHVAYQITQLTGPDIYGVMQIVSGASTRGQVITAPMGTGENKKAAKAVKLNLGLADFTTSVFLLTGSVSVKIAPQNRKLWSYAFENGTAPAADKLVINGTLSGFAKAEAGDEVTILQGLNAGEIRHIKSIANPGASNETWTLDSVLPNITEANVTFNVSPFKLVEKYQLPGNLYSIKDHFFTARNQQEGKKFYVKVVFEGLNASINLMSLSFIYDDLGTLQ